MERNNELEVNKNNEDFRKDFNTETGAETDFSCEISPKSDELKEINEVFDKQQVTENNAKFSNDSRTLLQDEGTSTNLTTSNELLEINVLVNELNVMKLNSNVKKGTNVLSLENKNKIKKSATEKFMEIQQKVTDILSFSARHRPRQPFLNARHPDQSSGLPPPPNYYPGPHRPSSPVTQEPSGTSHSDNSHRIAAVHQYETPHYTQVGSAAFFNTGTLTAVIWAPYPSKIPSSIPACLAHLVDLDVLFIIQKVDIIELATQQEEPNTYFVQNKRGETLYYAFETTGGCEQNLCKNARSFQLHIMDMYQNEVIFMNRPCGCTYYFCCYPVMEVYAPPSVPVGAITKTFSCLREEFVILDADENVRFKIYGETKLDFSCSFRDYDFSIHACDGEETQVGFIRREIGNSFRIYVSQADLYAVSFPENMDVRIKATFLGALFLFSLKRTGWVLRNVEDPETVSGHMYRMSIMTFLIPDFSGVDKTRCMKLSLVHDLAECIVGDLTPFCGVDPTEKHRQEDVAMKQLTQLIGDSGAEIYKLYKEYEAQETDESKFIKDLDRLDMILQAFEYEKLRETPGTLEEFFASTLNKFHFPWTIEIVKEIYKQRNLHMEKKKQDPVH